LTLSRSFGEKENLSFAEKGSLSSIVKCLLPLDDIIHLGLSSGSFSHHFSEHLYRKLKEKFGTGVIYLEPQGNNRTLLTEFDSADSLIAAITSLSSKELFSITLASSTLDELTEHQLSVSCESKALVLQPSKHTFGYLLKDLSSSIAEIRKSLTLMQREEVQMHFLDRALSELDKNTISEAIFLNFLVHSFYKEEDISTKWLISKIHLLGERTALFRSIIQPCFFNYLNKESSAITLFESALNAFSPYQFNTLFSGSFERNVSLYCGLNDGFELHGEERNIEGDILLELFMFKMSASHSNISSLLDTLKQAQCEGYYIPCELTTLFVAGSTKHSASRSALSEIKSIDSLTTDQKKWIGEQTKRIGLTDFECALSAALKNPAYKSTISTTDDITKKVEFILSLAGDKFTPTAHNLSRALLSHVEDAVSILFNKVDLRTFCDQEISQVLRGIKPDTPKVIIDIIRPHLNPFLEQTIKKGNPQECCFVAMRNLMALKRSFRTFVFPYMRDSEFFDESVILKELKTASQLKFYLLARDISPFELLERNIDGKINNKCLELMAG
jgi:hypothetical protein